MELIFYTTSDEPNKVRKSLSVKDTLTGTLKEECSITRPSILITSATSDIGNYMYIPEFGRYYFIETITSVRQGLWEVSGRCDVLYTYQDGILSLNAVIKRQESVWNLYLDDPNFKVYNNKLIQTKTFPTGFNAEPEFILTVAGGL